MGINLLDWRRLEWDICNAAGAGSEAKAEGDGGRFVFGEGHR